MQLSELKAVHFTMCFWLLHTQTFHEPAILLRRELTGFFAVSRPLVLPVLKPLIQQNEAISFPVQRLDSVPLSSAEQKERIWTGNEVQSIIAVTILGSMDNDQEMLAACVDYMSDDMTAPVINVNKFLASKNGKGAKMRLENPPRYKPEKKKKKGMMSSLGM